MGCISFNVVASTDIQYVKNSGLMVYPRVSTTGWLAPVVAELNYEGMMVGFYSIIILLSNIQTDRLQND